MKMKPLLEIRFQEWIDFFRINHIKFSDPVEWVVSLPDWNCICYINVDEKDDDTVKKWALRESQKRNKAVISIIGRPLSYPLKPSAPYGEKSNIRKVSKNGIAFEYEVTVTSCRPLAVWGDFHNEPSETIGVAQEIHGPLTYSHLTEDRYSLDSSYYGYVRDLCYYKEVPFNISRLDVHGLYKMEAELLGGTYTKFFDEYKKYGLFTDLFFFGRDRADYTILLNVQHINKKNLPITRPKPPLGMPLIKA